MTKEFFSGAVVGPAHYLNPPKIKLYNVSETLWKIGLLGARLFGQKLGDARDLSNNMNLGGPRVLH